MMDEENKMHIFHLEIPFGLRCVYFCGDSRVPDSSQRVAWKALVGLQLMGSPHLSLNFAFIFR